MNSIIRLITGRPLITCLVIGVVLMSVWWLKFQKKLNMKWYWAPILSAIAFAFGIASAKLWALIEVGFDLNQAASMRVYGPIFVLPILAYFAAKLTKRDPALVVDVMTVIVMIGVGMVRVNCLIAGCCKGVLITAEGTARWPLVELEMLLYIVLSIYFWNRIYKRQTKGLAFPVFILIYGIFRFIIEWVREEYTGEIWIFHMAHIWSLVAIIGSAITIYLIKKHMKKDSLRKPHSKSVQVRRGR